MNNEKKIRNSSFELLRIISMIFIIIGHVIYYGKFLTLSSPKLYSAIMILEILLIVHVNSYILVTGYFQSTSKTNIKKIIILIFNIFFYKAIFLLILILTKNIAISDITLSNFIFDYWGYNYWFLNTYIVLYLLSPFLNIIIKKLNKKSYLILLLTMFIFCSCLTTIIYPSFIKNNAGYSLLNFIFLYFIGAYFKKYPIGEMKIFNKKKFVPNFVLFIISYLLISLINYTVFYIANRYFGSSIAMVLLNYDNPLVILSSISYFLVFYFINIKSKIINFIARYNFDVYLIHENKLIKYTIYAILGFNLTKYNSLNWIGKILLGAIFIYISCVFLGTIKSLIFYIFNKLKVLKKINSYIDKLNEKYNKILDNNN